MDTLMSNALPDWGRDYTQDGAAVDFSKTFGVLFSGVTGIMIGANMSGNSPKCFLYVVFLK